LLRISYASSIREEMSRILSEWQQCKGYDANDGLLSTVIRHLENQVKSGIAFGYTRLADLLSNLELLARSIRTEATEINAVHRTQWDRVYTTIMQLIDAGLDDVPVDGRAHPDCYRQIPGFDGIRHLYCLGVIPDLATNLKPELDRHGFQVHLFPDLNYSIDGSGIEPDIIIIDLDELFDNRQHNGTLRNLLGQFQPDALKIGLSVRDDITARLAAIQAGINQYIIKPVSVQYITDMLMELSTGSPERAYRVLVLEQDRVLGRYYGTVLEQSGFSVTVIDTPYNLIQAINEGRPELLLLGDQVYEHKGYDLARLLRQDKNFSSISILLMSSVMPARREQQLLSSGIDDILLRPLLPEQLVTAVKARASRVRSLASVNTNMLTTLRDLQNQQRAMNQHFAVCVTNLDREIIYVNPRFESMTGYTQQDLLGRHHKILFSESVNRDKLKQLYTELGRNNVWQGELCGQRKDGSPYWTLLTLIPFLDDQGRPYQYVAIFSDITSRIKMEKELQLARDNAVMADRAKSEFLSSMSHELRTPMNAILGFAQLLKEGKYDTPGKYHQYHNEIFKAGHHLLQLINDVLDLARIEQNELSVDIISVPLKDILQECCALIMPLAESREVSIHHEYTSDEDVVVLADPLRLKQIFVNLLSNAIKYNIHGGIIRIEWVWHTIDKIRISITDTGMGIPPDQLDNLFQPFGRLEIHKREEGVGIGLALSKRLVHLMKGEIQVSSKLMEGTTFVVIMEADTSLKNVVRASRIEVIPPLTERILSPEFRILYIEDSFTNYRVMKAILSLRPNYRLIHVEDAETGIALIHNNRPDMVLMDIQLPGINGIAAFQQIRKTWTPAQLPVIAVTAYADQQFREKIVRTGFDDYITKPLIVDTFLSTLDRYVPLSDVNT